MKRGLLITLEGTEGCGKTTQLKLLEHVLRQRGIKPVVTREPGGTSVGDAVRKVLLDRQHHEMLPVTETLLYMASRAQLVERVIKPRLAQGKVILCDRWLDATVAYQGYANGVDVRWIWALGAVATQGISPDLTLFLDLPVACGLRRAKRRGRADRIERKALRFHEKVHQGYRKIALSDPKRVKRISISERDSVADVHEKIKSIVEEFLCRKRR